MPAPTWIAIAHLLRPQGRRGELLADPLTDLAAIFTDGRPVWLSASLANTPTEPAPGSPEVTLESHFRPTGRNAGRLVLKLSAANSISDAEALAGRTIFIPSTDAPTLDADTYFVSDLIGCTLLNGDTPAGTVTDLEFPTAPDGRTRLEDAAPLLVVSPLSASSDAPPAIDSDHTDNTTLVPFIRAWIISVDIPNKRLAMNLPDGLLNADPGE